MVVSRFIKRRLASAALGLLLAGCGSAAPRTAAPAHLPTATPTATTIPAPTATPDVTALAAAFRAELPGEAVQPVTDAEGTVRVQRLHASAEARPVWVAFSTGLAKNPGFQHVVALYTFTNGGWLELARTTLAHPSILRDDSVAEAAITPDQVWLGVRGDSGLVGPCCYDLLRFDGTALHNELSFSERNIEAIAVQRGADNTPEVAIVVQPWGGAAGSAPAPVTTVWRWDGQRMLQR